jgi:hypothetical protein
VPHRRVNPQSFARPNADGLVGGEGDHGDVALHADIDRLLVEVVRIRTKYLAAVPKDLGVREEDGEDPEVR